MSHRRQSFDQPGLSGPGEMLSRCASVANGAGRHSAAGHLLARACENEDPSLDGPWMISTFELREASSLTPSRGVPSVLNVFISSMNNTDPYLGAAALQILIRTLPLGWSVTASVFY
jgi:hypothetical protein